MTTHTPTPQPVMATRTNIGGTSEHGYTGWYLCVMCDRRFPLPFRQPPPRTVRCEVCSPVGSKRPAPEGGDRE